MANFGLSAVIDGIQSRLAQLSMAASVCGMPQWMALECHKGEPPSKASNIYSLGLTMWKVSVFQFPEKMEVINQWKHSTGI
jgi:serine/threonine protein kinase